VATSVVAAPGTPVPACTVVVGSSTATSHTCRPSDSAAHSRATAPAKTG
jgi:hypothetical protein